jgi:hypothetical protein
MLIDQDDKLHVWGGVGDVANYEFHPVTPPFTS